MITRLGAASPMHPAFRMRLSMVLPAMLLGTLGGCDDGSCLDGVCPDYAEARKLPGPCRAGWTSRPVVELEYDDLDRLRSALYVGLKEIRDNGEVLPHLAGSTWTYDATGRLKTARVIALGPIQEYQSDWMFGADEVKLFLGPNIVTSYRTSELEFLPLVGLEVLEPVAELGLVTYKNRPVEWTVEATPTGTVRTRRILPELGTPQAVSISVFELDERGRIVLASHDRDGDGTAEGVERFVYEGDRLVHQERVRDHYLRSQLPHTIDWTYDAGGNVVEGIGNDGYREVYSYDCW